MEANNNKAMREALETVRDAHYVGEYNNGDAYEGFNVEADDGTGRPLICVVEEALEKPPRNCDVGSATEQAARFIKFCKGHRELLPGRCEVCSVKCPCRQCGDLNLCVLFWAQMPYEEKGAK